MSVRGLLALCAMMLASTIVQIGIVPALFLDALRAPVLPVAALAAWSASSRPASAWIAAVPVALMLASVSDVRAGWFLLALAPTPLLVASMRGAMPAPPAAMLGAALGAAAYLSALALAANRLGLLAGALDATAQAAGLTAIVGLAVAIVLIPLRPRDSGLFRT